MRITVAEFLKRRSRSFWIAFTIFSLAVLLQVSERVLISVEGDRSKISISERSVSIVTRVRTTFDSFQKEALETGHAIALDPRLNELLTRNIDSVRADLFVFLQRANAGAETSIEIYDHRGGLLAWQGRAAGVEHLEAPTMQETSFVSRGPVYSYLTLVVPTKDPARGSLIIHRLFDVNYPFSNRFINSEDFKETFPQRLGFPVTFEFSDVRTANLENRLLSVPLEGLNGSIVGHAFVEEPTLSDFAQRVHTTIFQISGVLLFFLSVIIFFSLGRMLHRQPVLWIRLIGILGLSWIIRYVWLWYDFPSNIFEGSIFDPRYFASPFGWGIARSAGELLITTSIMCANLVYGAAHVVPELVRYVRNQKVRTTRKSWYLLFLFPAAIVYFFMQRGFIAAIRSAVVDSSLVFNDPSKLLPSFELASILLSLGLLGLATIIGMLLTIGAAYAFSRRAIVTPTVGGLATAIVFLLVGIAFGLFQVNPLIGQISRAVIFIGFFLLILYLLKTVELGNTQAFSGVVLRPGTIVLLLATAIVLLVMHLDSEIHRKEKTRVELLANDLSRPFDAWLTFLLEQAIRDVSGPQTFEILSSGNSNAIQDLAFQAWAKGILSREGYNSAVTFFGPDGNVLSSFNIGTKPILTTGSASSRRNKTDTFSTDQIVIEKQEIPGSRRKVYVGSRQLIASDGTKIGTIVVEVSAAERALFRGETPPILRSHTGEQFDTYLRTIFFSEFLEGHQTYTTGENVSRVRPLPQEIVVALNAKDETEQSVWTHESFEGKGFETYYLRAGNKEGKDVIIALSLETVDWRWHFFDLLRMFLYYFLVVCFGGMLFVGVRYARGEPIVFSFRNKLLAAFLAVSLIPMIVIAYFTRQITIERAKETILQRLSEQASTLGTRVSAELPFDQELENNFVHRINDRWCEAIGAEMGADFSVYVDGEEHGSSKPELFRAEILDRRLSGDAFLHVSLQRKSFYYENQNIGRFAYLIGYRPIVSSSGRLLGIMAIPLLYQELEVAEELARRQALLFGAYTLVLLIAVFLGSIFANQISSPLRQMIAATRRIAGGDLNFRLPQGRSDEFGELHQAFNKMTNDVRVQQEQLRRVERESAWKEMAKQVAHEIKNPLTPMKLSIQHLRQAFHDKDVNIGSLFEQVTKTIIDQIDALSRISSEFARFARMPRRREENLDVNEVLTEAAKLLEEYENVQIQLLLTPTSLFVRADREELRRSFINILRNSIEAMREKGNIKIQTSIRHHECSIEIVDTGPGIPEKFQEKLFEPNFSTKTEGMGLGLAIVKKTIDDLRGTISIQSSPGKGTTVSILIPLIAENNA